MTEQVMPPSDIPRDAPLRLAVAAKIAFPDGSMGAPGLRKERDKGRLTTEMIAGKEYTTLADIERMRELCRIVRSPMSLDAESATRRRDALKMHLKQLGDRLSSASESAVPDDGPALARARAAAQRLREGAQKKR